MTRIFTPLQYLNLHTHHPTGAPSVFEIGNVSWGQNPEGITRFRSAGLHPWQLDNPDLEAAAIWLQGQAADPNTLLIGEAGLDKVTNTPWDIQLKAFNFCIAVAKEYQKPLILHCVKAYSEVLDCLKQVGGALPAVFHGIDKHPQTAQMLWQAGYYLSFGAALFRPNSYAAEALRQTPADRFFLETDDQEIDIKTVYTRAAEIRNLSVQDLKAQIWKNFEQISGRVDIFAP